jgi:hypothetical protein
LPPAYGAGRNKNQTPRNKIQAGRNKTKARRNKIQIQRNEINGLAQNRGFRPRPAPLVWLLDGRPSFHGHGDVAIQ